MGPSPPIMKYVSGYFLPITGIISTNKSIPFLYVNLERHTILIVFYGFLFVGSGLNFVESTAFGITDTICGFNDALNTKFSLHV